MAPRSSITYRVRITVAFSNSWPEKIPCSESRHDACKPLTGGGLLPIADIGPDMSASILAGSGLAVSDVERVSRD